MCVLPSTFHQTTQLYVRIPPFQDVFQSPQCTTYDYKSRHDLYRKFSTILNVLSVQNLTLKLLVSFSQILKFLLQGNQTFIKGILLDLIKTEQISNF